MNYVDFLKQIMKELDEVSYAEFRDLLVEDYIPFSIIEKKSVSKEALFEKLCDYFEKIELKTGKKFEKLIGIYADDLENLVGNRIAKEPKAKKNEPTPPIPRARRYYDKITVARKSNDASKQVLVDYSRIMLCLYMSIIRQDLGEISDFDYSVGSINLTKIIDSMRAEKGSITKKSKFDTKEIYGKDRCTFILVIVMFYYIKSKEVIGEY